MRSFRCACSASDEDNDVDVVWQDRLSIARNKYERGSIVVFRYDIYYKYSQE